MSLAQKPERSSNGSTPAVPRVGAPTIDLRSVARHPGFMKGGLALPLPTLAEKPAAPGVSHADLALNLLAEVTSALPRMVERSQALEAMLTTSREESKAELDAANDVARQWQQLAQQLKTQVDHLEQRVAGSEQRADAAEERANAAQAQVEQANRTAEQAERASALLQDKVIKAFGAGSPGHSILESVRAQLRAN